MLQAFLTYIHKENLLQPNHRILLAVSGGIDSVVLCALFSKANLNFGIAHCNFQLRADESNADELFVEALAEKYNVPFHSTSFETEVFAKKNKLSIQVAARDLRYQWFESIRSQFNYTSIATAHHINDSIETFFINLIRGTGVAGLHGILPKQGNLIRPMLFANKDSIQLFAKENKLKHREDSSNASDKYLRNNIRKKIIPALKALNPSIENTISKDIEHLRDVEFIYNAAIEKARKRIIVTEKDNLKISIAQLKKLKPLESYLFEFLKPFNFNSTTSKEIAAALQLQSGKQFFSESHVLLKDRTHLIIKSKSNLKPKEAPASKEFSIKKSAKLMQMEGFSLHIQLQKVTELKAVNKSKSCASIDLQKLQFPLTIRKWKQGDVFQPLGMKGKKKLSDFFVDQKLSLFEKENTWVMLSANTIVWVIGHRVDDRFKITDKTKQIYFVELH